MARSTVAPLSVVAGTVVADGVEVGVGVGVGVAVDLGVGVGAGIEVEVGEGDGIGIGVGVAVGVGVGVGVGANVAEIIFEARTLVKVNELTSPTELLFTETSAM